MSYTYCTSCRLEVEISLLLPHLSKPSGLLVQEETIDDGEPWQQAAGSQSERQNFGISMQLEPAATSKTHASGCVIFQMRQREMIWLVLTALTGFDCSESSRRIALEM